MITALIAKLPPEKVKPGLAQRPTVAPKNVAKSRGDAPARTKIAVPAIETIKRPETGEYDEKREIFVWILLTFLILVLPAML